VMQAGSVSTCISVFHTDFDFSPALHRSESVDFFESTISGSLVQYMYMLS
jgi:hypothetical protein